MRRIVLACALACGSAAGAQTAPPQPADAGTRSEIADFTRCLVTHRREDARRAVLEHWDSRRLVYREWLREPQCYRLGRGFRSNSAVLRSSAANQLILSDLGPEDVARVPAAPPLPYATPDPVRTVDSRGRPASAASLERQREAIARRLNWVVIGQFGECVARANPAAVPVLAASPVASPAEIEALKAFGPQMPQCLPKGVRLELDRSSLRGAIVLAYYRLAMAARSQPVQGTVQ